MSIHYIENVDENHRDPSGPLLRPRDGGACAPEASRWPRAFGRSPTRRAWRSSTGSRSVDECCVCDLNAAFDLSQPTISHHLRVLRDAGLVESSRRGTWAFYRLVPEAIGRAAANARRMTRVLFVCVQNAGRSQIARRSTTARGGEAPPPAPRRPTRCIPAVVEALEELDHRRLPASTARPHARRRRMGRPRRDDGLRRRLPGPARQRDTSTGTSPTRRPLP